MKDGSLDLTEQNGNSRARKVRYGYVMPAAAIVMLTVGIVNLSSGAWPLSLEKICLVIAFGIMTVLALWRAGQVHGGVNPFSKHRLKD